MKIFESTEQDWGFNYTRKINFVDDNNHHNGYYNHGFEMKRGDQKVRDGTI